MPRENSIPSGMSTLPTTVINTIGKVNTGTQSLTSTRGTKVRVTGVNPVDGSILYEPLEKNIGMSSLGSPSFNYVAKLGNSVNASIPFVGEIVEIFSAPDISLAESKDQATFVTYYNPTPINIWQNQNNNVILDPTVQGQAPEDPMGDISLDNYQRSLDGFVPNDGLRSYSIPSSNPSYIPFNLTITDAQQQKIWLLSYIQSPVYKERLKKEYPGKDDVFIQAELNKRINNLKTSTVQIIPKIGSVPGEAAGVSIAKKASGLTWNGRTWVAPSNAPDPQFRSGVAYVEKKQYGGWEGIPVHELSHITDDGGSLIPMSTIQKIYKYTGGGDQTNLKKKYGNMAFDYYTTPTEFIARMNVLRYLMKQQGIYDASVRAFTAQDLEKMFQNNLIINNTAFQEIFNQFSSGLKGDEAAKKKAFIDLMNTVAYNEAYNDIVSRTA